MSATTAKRRLAEIVNHDRAMAASGAFGDDSVDLTILHCNRPQMQSARLIVPDACVVQLPTKTTRQRLAELARYPAERARAAWRRKRESCLSRIVTAAYAVAEWAERKSWGG